MAYGTIYTVPFKSILNKSCEFRIQKDGYSGASTELTGTAYPAIREGKGDNDELEDRIIRSNMKVGINSLTNYAYLELFTSDAFEYRGQLYVDSSLYWQGFLTPDYYQEPYVPAPYEVTLLFTDGLGLLKNIDWEAEQYNKDLGITLMQTILFGGITYCLDRINNLLPYTEAINIIEENQTDTDATTMLKQTYFDCRRFNEMTCYEALDEILKICGNACMWQQDGRWWIVSRNLMKQSSFTARRYTYQGVYEDYYTVEPLIEITDNSGNPLNVFLDDPTLTILPAWKKFVLNQDYGFNENILDIYNFTKAGLIVADTDGTYNEQAYYLHIGTTPTAYVYNFGMYLQYNLGTVEGVTSASYILKVTFAPFFVHQTPTLSYGAVYSVFIRSGGTVYWLYSDGTWNTTQPAITELSAGVNTPSNVTTEPLPINGTIYMRIYNLIKPGDTTDIYFYDKDQLSVSLIKSGDSPESKTVTTEINDEQNYTPDDYDVMLGDLPNIDNNDIMYQGGLYRYSGGEFIPTEYWKVRGSTELKHIVNLVADEISVNHIRPMVMISGSLRCNFKPGSVIKSSVDSDRLFVLKRFSEDIYNDEWNCDLVEFAYAEQGYLKLRSGGYVTLRGGGKIKLRQ